MSDDASKVYGSQVAAIIDGDARDSDWQPRNPVELFVTNRHAPASTAELDETELLQLSRIWPGEDLDKLMTEGLDDFPLDIECALVVDASGTPRYRLYGANFGCVYLLATTGLECIAFASQHEVEHWHADQRDIFWAMDRALRRGDHGFRQPMRFCWWRDQCWADIADKPKGTVRSEPYVRKQLAGEN